MSPREPRLVPCHLGASKAQRCSGLVAAASHLAAVAAPSALQLQQKTSSEDGR
jgi:hypothetical protein